jgi:peptidyl-prolyl cis-trans isomerase B (cyclophilin B)
MARTSDPHSASSQFFINMKDNAFLDFKSRSPDGWGYCVFGAVVEGMEVVDRIVKAPTTRHGGHQDVPVEDIIIESAREIADS